jgi:hypothetical protein
LRVSSKIGAVLCPAAKGGALSVETVLWRSSVSFAASMNSRTLLPLFNAGHEHGKQTNEFAAHEQLYTGKPKIQFLRCFAVPDVN